MGEGARTKEKRKEVEEMESKRDILEGSYKKNQKQNKKLVSLAHLQPCEAGA